MDKPFIPKYNEIVPPCHEDNLTLWRLFCAVTGRDANSLSPHWTTQDVCTILYTYASEGRAKVMEENRKNNDAGRAKKHIDQNSTVEFGSGDNIGSNNPECNVVDFREASSTAISSDNPPWVG